MCCSEAMEQNEKKNKMILKQEKIKQKYTIMLQLK
jgi:hypothetical protein